MNILIEIADKDVFFIALFIVGLLIFGAVIFFTLTKNKAKALAEERMDIEKEQTTQEEMFPEIKPETEEQQKAKEELERVFNQMANDLENQKHPQTIEQFEREQEENAIISYQELIKQAESKKAMQIEKQEKPNDEVLNEYLHTPEVKPKEEIKPKQLKMEIEEEPKKFKNSAIISPIFGIQSEPNYESSKKQASPRHAYGDNSASYEQENNTEFLNSLKEFRKNL